MTSRFIEIRPDNIPADGKISFKNGFPVLSFTISAQNGLLDPRSVRIIGNFAAYSDNLATPTPIVDGDGLTMNNRLGIYNVFESLTIRANRSKMICESIRHYSKYLNSYFGVSSSLQDQMGHLGETALIMPNAETFRKSVMESANTDAPQTNSFSAHIPSGFMMGGNLVDLRPDAFGGLQIEFLLQPDANVLYATDGDISGNAEAHYELSDLKLVCEVQDVPDDMNARDEGVMEFNTITSLYTSINSTNAQIQYNLALRNVLSAFMTFVPVANINSFNADGQTTTYPSGKGSSDTDLAFFKRIQFLKGGSKYPADFDFVNNIVTNGSSTVPDPQIVKNFVEALSPDYTMHRVSISPQNANRNYDLTTSTASSSYTNIPEGGALTGLGVTYGLGGQGEDFSMEQFGVSIESELDRDNPIGVYIFVKAKSQVVYNRNGIQVMQ